jgi:plastocyanin
VNMQNVAGVLAAVMLMVAGVGCASGNSRQPAGPEPAATVTMGFHSFKPATVTIKSGQTVRWNNKAMIWHTVTADPAAAKEPGHVALPAGAEPFDSGKVKSGNSYWHTFSVPGTYRYICKPHESSGMLGTVVVEPTGDK